MQTAPPFPYFHASHETRVLDAVRTARHRVRAWALAMAHMLAAYTASFCPQAPNQTAGLCECSFNRTKRPTKRPTKLPSCVPTQFCSTSSSARAAAERPVAKPPIDVSFVIVYGFNQSKVRYWYRPDPFRSYLNAMRLIVRLLLSLEAASSVLPVHLLLSGERQHGFEQALLGQFRRLRLLDADTTGRHRIRVPVWASAFHHGSFAKLAVLSLTQFRRIILLDTDTVVLRNIDHLARAPAPSFVFRFKCWSYRAAASSRNAKKGAAIKSPIWEMNSGLAVLNPHEELHVRMQALMNGNGSTARARSTGARPALPVHEVYVPSDPGDQSVWRHFFQRVHELPVEYNTFKKSILPAWTSGPACACCTTRMSTARLASHSRACMRDT